MKRNISIDSIRGLAIVLMVFGHCIQCGSGQLFFDNHFYFDIFLYKVIYSFHMPLFAFVSGLFIYSSINKRGWGGYIKRILISVFCPLLCWSIIGWGGLFIKNGIIISFWDYFIGNLWFLWATFFSSIIITFVHQIQNEKLKAIVFGFVVSFSLLIPNSGIISNCVFVFPFFIIGYFVPVLSKRNMMTSKNKLIYACLSFIIFIILICFYDNNDYVYNSGTCILKANTFNVGQLYKNLFRWLIGIAGTLTIFFSMSESKISLFSRPNVLSKLGLISIGIYIISSYLNLIMLELLAKLSPCFFLWIIECTVIIIVSVTCTELLSRQKVLNILMLGGRSIKNSVNNQE